MQNLIFNITHKGICLDCKNRVKRYIEDPVAKMIPQTGCEYFGGSSHDVLHCEKFEFEALDLDNIYVDEHLQPAKRVNGKKKSEIAVKKEVKKIETALTELQKVRRKAD